MCLFSHLQFKLQVIQLPLTDLSTHWRKLELMRTMRVVFDFCETCRCSPKLPERSGNFMMMMMKIRADWVSDVSWLEPVDAEGTGSSTAPRRPQQQSIMSCCSPQTGGGCWCLLDLSVSTMSCWCNDLSINSASVEVLCHGSDCNS